jgi:hypothetical protein
LPSFISSLRLPREPDIKGKACGPGICVKFNPTPSSRAEAAPFADEREFLEQRGLDAQHVISRHVLGIVDAFEHEKLDMGIAGQVRHAESSPAFGGASNAKIESIRSNRFRFRMSGSESLVRSKVAV